MNGRAHRSLTRLLPLALSLSACQSYDFVFQPDTNRLGLHLRFAVEQPSKADILFVVDNSGSMKEEQQALQNSIADLLTELAPRDTSYRIGITSTDVVGYTEDCFRCDFSKTTPCSSLDPRAHAYSSDPASPYYYNYPMWGQGARGNCDFPAVKLNRPHDGARGRLIAAYDAREFALAKFPELDTQQEQDAFASLAPTDVTKARWVIDRDVIQTEACTACACDLATCKKGNGCFDTCAKDVGASLVIGFFRSNIAGLGLLGSGYEQGLLAGSWSIGIDPRLADNANVKNELKDNAALTQGADLTADGAPNSYTADAAKAPTSWLRDEALLGVMFVSDEQDCSMQEYLFNQHTVLEDGASLPVSSMCYLPTFVPAAGALSPQVMARLVVKKKGNSASRVAAGFIGGLRKTDGKTGRAAVAADCVSTAMPKGVPVDAAGFPSTECSCVASAPAIDYQKWCQFTLQTSDPGLPGHHDCDALGGSRYIDFVNRFYRRAFDSICLAGDPGTPGFGPTLATFGKSVTLACFDLKSDVAPARADPDRIIVRRAARASAEAGEAPVELPRVARDAADTTQEAWYYEEAQDDDPAKICLTGFDRLIGDVYDIFVLTTDSTDFTK